MEMRRMVFVSSILVTWAVSANCARPHVQPLIPQSDEKTLIAPSTSPSSSDCSQVIYAMSDCIPFMSDGSKTTTPEGSCCSGYKTVLKTGADCVCESIESSADLGIPLNMTKVMTLSSACGINNAPPLTNCDVPLPPGNDIPANSPKSVSSPPKSHPKINIVPAPSVATAPPTPTPTPTPSPSSGAYSISANLALTALFFGQLALTALSMLVAASLM